MDKVIVTALLVIAAVTAGALVVTTLTPVIGRSSRSIIESNKDLAARIETNVKIIAVHPENSSTVKVWVKNIGGTGIEELTGSDLFISSTDGSVFVPLSKQSVLTATSTWHTTKTGIWSEGETIDISISLGPGETLISDKTYDLSFSTSNGVNSSYRFGY